ncbi:MAG: hypothetical protein NTW84_04775 [Methanothrix sp.]|nr:hypothetical protein [Methanothrix sp.]
MTIGPLVLFIFILSSIYLCQGSLHWEWEMRLKAQFGKEYEEYRKKVPRFIPAGDQSLLEMLRKKKRDG